MKIGVFLGSNPDAGGIFQYTISILDALAQLKDQNQIRVFYIEKEWEIVLSRYPFEKKVLVFGKIGLFLANTLLYLRFSGALTRFISSFFNPIAWVLNNEKLDYLFFPAQDAISYQIKSNTVTTIHDLMHIYEARFPEVSDSGRREIRDHRFSNIARYSKIILVDSEIGKDHVAECYGTKKEKIFSLPYIPHKELLIVKGEKINLINTNLPSSYFFYPAQFWAHKNHANLIRALALVKNKFHDVSIVFSGGKTREYEKLNKLIQELGLSAQVYFVGYLTENDLVYVYKNARAMIMPTFFGPTNIPPLEAMLFNCPVAVSKIYGMPEQLKEASLYFDPTNVNEIADIMEKLWSDDQLCQHLIEEGKKKSRSWNIESYSRRLNEVLMIDKGRTE